MTDLHKLENYCMRFDSLKSSMEDDVRELMEQCLTLSDAYDIIEDETYKFLSQDDIREYMWAIIGALDKHRILKQKVKVRMDTLLLINSRIKKMAKPYGLEDLLGATLNDYLLHETVKTLSDEETDKELRFKVTKIIEELE
mgnify:CR=1 FL=1